MFRFALFFCLCIFLLLTNVSICLLASEEDKKENADRDKLDLLVLMKKNNESVKGKFVDEFGVALVGVVVEAISSKAKTVTNTEGEYLLKVEEDSFLIFKILGAPYDTIRVPSSKIVNYQFIY